MFCCSESLTAPRPDRCSPSGGDLFFHPQGGQGIRLMTVLSLSRDTEVRHWELSTDGERPPDEAAAP